MTLTRSILGNWIARYHGVILNTQTPDITEAIALVALVAAPL